MSRRTYIFAGPPGSGDALMGIVEAATGRQFIRDAGADPYIRLDPAGIYLSGHDFDDGDLDDAEGRPIPLRTAYPCLVEVTATDRDQPRQEELAGQIFAAIQADGRLAAVYADDMQHVRGVYQPGPDPAS